MPTLFTVGDKANEKSLTKENYKERFHDMLYAEEIAQFNLMGKFNIKTRILATKSCTVNPSTSSISKVNIYNIVPLRPSV